MWSRTFAISIFVASSLCFINDSFALEIGEQEAAATVTESYVSRYIWRGQDLYATDDAAYQPSIDITLPGFLEGTDASFNIWGSFPMSAGHEDAEELDYTISLSRDIQEDYNLSFGYTYFDFPNTTGRADVQEPWASFTFNKIPGLPIDVAVNLFAGYDFKAKSGGPDEGWYYSWGFDTELPLPKLPVFQQGQSLTLGLVNWGNDGVADLEPSFLYASEFSVSSSYSFGAFQIIPSLNYTINYKDEINSGNEEIWTGIEIGYLF